MKEFLSFEGLGMPGTMLQGYIGVLVDHQLPPESWMMVPLKMKPWKGRFLPPFPLFIGNLSVG